MLPFNDGTFRLFRFAGIDVFLHWSWFLIAVYEIQRRSPHSLSWKALEFIGLFVIVLLHEFGHSFACRQVGGRADRIVLWPLGGIAYVAPPQRPGATLWSIAAGPLVNVALVPISYVTLSVMRSKGLDVTLPDFTALLESLAFLNKGLLVFNILPIYPMDGGQILRSLLWYFLGRATSLTVASVVGFFGIAGLLGLALWLRSPWLGILVAFAGYNCWQGFRFSRHLAAFARLPRHLGYACPSCKSSPPIKESWGCPQCQTKFDTFATHATCPTCRTRFASTACPDCGHAAPIDEWVRSV